MEKNAASRGVCQTLWNNLNTKKKIIRFSNEIWSALDAAVSRGKKSAFLNEALRIYIDRETVDTIRNRTSLGTGKNYKAFCLMVREGLINDVKKKYPNNSLSVIVEEALKYIFNNNIEVKCYKNDWKSHSDQVKITINVDQDTLIVLKAIRELPIYKTKNQLMIEIISQFLEIKPWMNNKSIWDKYRITGIKRTENYHIRFTVQEYDKIRDYAVRNHVSIRNFCTTATYWWKNKYGRVLLND